MVLHLPTTHHSSDYLTIQLRLTCQRILLISPINWSWNIMMVNMIQQTDH